MSTLSNEEQALHSEIMVLALLKSNFRVSDGLTALNNTIDELVVIKNSISGAYDNVAAANSHLRANINEKNDQLSGLNSTRQNQQASIHQLQQDSTRLDNNIADKNRQINELKTAIAEKKATIISLITARDKANAERADAIIARDDAFEEKAHYASLITPLEQQITALKAEIAALEDALLLSDSRLLTTNNNILGLKDDIQDDKDDYLQKITKEQADIIILRDELLATLEQEAANERVKLNLVQVNAGAQSSLEDFILQTNANLTRVHENLRNAGSNYHLGPIDMALKMLPGSGGNSVSLPQLSDLKEVVNNHLSTIKVRFLPNISGQKKGNQPPKTNTPPLPDLQQQTQSYAIRQLQKRGLQVQLLQQIVDDHALVGRIVKQQPLASEPFPPNGLVRLWLGKYAQPKKATPTEQGKIR